MANRPGRWDLLGHDADPITTQPDEVAALAKYYQDMANDIETAAAQLRPVGDDDLSAGEGESVDAVRGRAKDVTKSLTQMHGRYSSAAEAFTGFHTAVGTEGDRSGGGTVMAVSWAALQAAEEADSELSRVSGTADPLQAAKDANREPTPEETDDASKRDNAIGQQKGALGAAHKQLEQAMTMLSDAGKQASSTMKGAWDDGLHDSGWYKFLHGLIKFFTIIGMILAVLAFFIPGLGLAAIVGAIGAVFSVIAAGLKFAVGEGSVLDVILAGIGLLTLGAGSAITKITTNAIGKGISAGKNAIRIQGNASVKIQENIQKGADQATKVVKDRIATLNHELSGNTGSISKLQELRKLKMDLPEITRVNAAKAQSAQNELKRLTTENAWRKLDFETKFKDDPNWWNLSKIKTVYGNDKKLIGDTFTGGKSFKDWGERFAGIDGMAKLGRINEWFGANGMAKPLGMTGSSSWHYGVGAWGSTFGKSTGIALPIVFPTGIGSDTSRPWTPWVDDHKGAFPDIHTLWNPDVKGPAAHA
ncbi:hypothetical protein [Curtobacterium sp. Leaf261]|uniref:hypothetical protein n=1 Tax=Curtobacterium sp. Leaf261 TaxID=1736311 RepID=UPI0006F32F89|nr:hypothetical protein [Curtobacterium sp. Leaf261]KQO59956.1 hypothetical protein ASF23_14985 [Curtobacterium sp. Leaf261]